MAAEDLIAEIRKADDLQRAYEGVGLLYFADFVERDCCPLIRGILAPHASDCAVHNAPALPPGPCDCGAK